jgi:DNA-binding phage protein
VAETLKVKGAVTVDQLLDYLDAHRDEVSVAQLAEDSGLARSVIYRLLRQRRNITVATLEALLGALTKATGAPCRLVITVGSLDS